MMAKSISIALTSVFFCVASFADTNCDYKIVRTTNLKGKFLVKKSYSTMKNECAVDIQQFENKSKEERKKIEEECFKKISDKVLPQVQSLKNANAMTQLAKDSLVKGNPSYKSYLAALQKRKISKISAFNLKKLVKTYFFSGAETENLKKAENSVAESKSVGFVSMDEHFRISQWTKKNEDERNRVGYYDNFLYYDGQIKAIAQNDKDAEVLNAITPAKKVDMADYEILKQGKILPSMNNEDYPVSAIYGSDFVLLKNKTTGNIKLFEVSGETDSNIRRVKSEKDLVSGQETKLTLTRKYKKGRVTVKYDARFLCQP